MSPQNASLSIKRLYWLTSSFGISGFVWYFWAQGSRAALAFILGALCSVGNLWLFDRLSRAIAPGETSRKPWQAGTYIARYLILLAAGYVIVKALNVSALAVVLGLLASTAAVVTSLIFELLLNLFKSRTSH